jgi:hypothetical protein
MLVDLIKFDLIMSSGTIQKTTFDVGLYFEFSYQHLHLFSIKNNQTTNLSFIYHQFKVKNDHVNYNSVIDIKKKYGGFY